jgi:uncharacterized protein YjbI with pentapeptide repeats
VRRWSYLLLLIFLVLLGAATPSQAQGTGDHAASRALARLSETEKWVLEKVAAGQVADLRERFGEAEEARTLRAAFLEALLSDGLSGFKAHRSGIYLVNAVIRDPLSLEFALVPHPTFLTGCRFLGPVNLGGAEFKKSLSLKQSVFTQGANFYRLKVGLDAFLGEAVFEGPADFGGGAVEGQFILAGARFNDKIREANFNGFAAGQSISLRNAVFEGPADFTGVKTGGEFNAREARFAGQGKKAGFNGLKVAQHASFLNANFAGAVDLGGAQIGGELYVDGARFESAGDQVSFNGLKVGPRASFDGTVFNGPVDFSMASVAGMLIFNRTRFENRDRPPNFFGLKVDQHAFFSDSVFKAGVSMVGASFKNLMLDGGEGAPRAYGEVNLDGTVVDYSLVLGSLSLEALQASRLQVKGPAILKKVQIRGKADLRDSSFYSVKLIEVSWPANPEEVWLEGLTYQSVSAGEGSHDWEKLLAWINLSRFDTRNYRQLEDFFRHGGYQDRADLVYIEGKRRETMQKWWHPYNLATLIFWDALAGYGKKPARTLWVSLLIVLLGTLVFDPRNFDPSFIGGWKWLLEGSAWRTRMVRFFLSLDEFLPGVDLGLARLWQLNKISYPTLLYYHFHKIAGWILIPVGLAAVLTQFK